MPFTPPYRIRLRRELGEALRARRRSLGLTQADLARKAGVRQPLISDIECGATNTRVETILDLCAFLELDWMLVEREKDDPFDPTRY
ncbi:MAG: helix-turn-helix domain-containing protein [Pseudomonadota bacterium]